VTTLTAGGIAVSTQVATDRHLVLASPVHVTFPTTGRHTFIVQAVYKARELAGEYIVPLAAAEANFPQQLDFQVDVKLPGVSAVPAAGGRRACRARRARGSNRTGQASGPAGRTEGRHHRVERPGSTLIEAHHRGGAGTRQRSLAVTLSGLITIWVNVCMRFKVPKNENTDRSMKTRHVRAMTLTAVALAFGVGICGIAAVTPAGASGTSRATVSAESSPYGQVLMVGSGTYAGYSLYEFNRDQPHHIACNTTVVATVKLSCAGPPADQTADWPALETQGKPVAGPGVDHRLLGSIYRTDLGARQVTYAGHPLYLFDTAPHQFSGELFLETVLPIPPWHGIWYLVSPGNGLPVAGAASLTTQTLPSGQNVLAAVMLPASGSLAITVYSYSKDTKRHSSCTGSCALVWPPVLTTGSPQ